MTNYHITIVSTECSEWEAETEEEARTLAIEFFKTESLVNHSTEIDVEIREITDNE